MIRFQDGEFADLLPSYLREKVDVVALSYAYKMAMQKMLIFEIGRASCRERV